MIVQCDMLHLLLAAQLAAASSNNAIAVVNIQRLYAETTVGKAATAKIAALRTERERALAEKQAAIEASAKRGVAPVQLQRMRLEFSRLVEDAEADVNELTRSVQADFEKRVRPLLQQLLEEDHVGMILEVPSPLVLWVNPSVDLTPKVKARLDAEDAKR